MTCGSTGSCAKTKKKIKLDQIKKLTNKTTKIRKEAPI